MPELSVNLCGITLPNPTVLASGILGTTRALAARVARCGAGAVTIKSISTEPRYGHPNPCIITFDAGMMNAVGYSNPGIEEALQDFADLGEVEAPVIASVIGVERVVDHAEIVPWDVDPDAPARPASVQAPT